MRKVSFKFLLLRGNAYCAQLRAIEGSAPTIRMNDSGEIKTGFSGVFAPEARDANGNAVEIDWLSDEIQPVLVIDGVEHSLGVFAPATPKATYDGVTESVSVAAYDRCWRVRDMRSESLLYWPAGTLYLDAVEQLLTAAGIQTVFKTPTAAAFTEAREDWALGTDYLTVVNDLLSEINYNQLWFDGSGNAVLEPVSVPEASAIEHVFDADDPDTRVLPGISRTTDVYSAPNAFTVVCANPDKSGVMTATSVNENPQSPLSVQRRGRRICSFRQVNNISSQSALQVYADRLRDESMITGETITISTGLLPGFGVADVVALHYRDTLGVCIERAYTMELRVGGRMTHTLEKVVYNLD